MFYRWAVSWTLCPESPRMPPGPAGSRACYLSDFLDFGSFLALFRSAFAHRRWGLGSSLRKDSQWGRAYTTKHWWIHATPTPMEVPEAPRTDTTFLSKGSGSCLCNLSNFFCLLCTLANIFLWNPLIIHRFKLSFELACGRSGTFALWSCSQALRNYSTFCKKVNFPPPHIHLNIDNTFGATDIYNVLWVCVEEPINRWIWGRRLARVWEKY